MNNIPTLLKAAALGSSLLLFSGFMWYQTVGYKTLGAPAVAEEPAAEDGEANENAASARDIELIDMSGSKSEAPLIKVPRQKAGYVVEEIKPKEGGSQQQRKIMPGPKWGPVVERAPVVESKPAPRTIMPGSKSARMAAPPATPPVKKQDTAMLPGSKSLVFRETAPVRNPPPEPRPVMGGSKSKAVFVPEDTRRNATNATEHAKQILKEWEARMNQEGAGQTQRSQQIQAPAPQQQIKKQQEAAPRMYLESSKSGRIFVPPASPLAPEKQR